MWYPERRELWVEYQGKILNLFDYDGKKFDWRDSLDLSALDLDNDKMPNLSKIVVHGDLNVSQNNLTSFKKLPRIIYGSLYANFNQIDSFDAFPDLVGRECIMLGNRYRGTMCIEDGRLGSPNIVTQDYYLAWRNDQMQKLVSIAGDTEKMFELQQRIFDEDAFVQAQRMSYSRQQYLYQFSEKLKEKNKVPESIDVDFDEDQLSQDEQEAKVIGMVVAVEEDVLPRTVVRAWERHRKKRMRRYPCGRYRVD